MRIISFDISGPFAHFRKIYGTNTAMTYSFPPRTSVCGLVAGMLGLPKDTWHDGMTPDRLRVGIANLLPQRRTFHRVNNLRVKNVLDLRGRLAHVQTPLELLTGNNPRTDEVRYRIYLGGAGAGDLLDRLADNLTKRTYAYAPCLGAAFCPAFVGNYTEIDGAAVREIPAGERVELTTVTNHAWIDAYALPAGGTLKIEDDTYPLFYESNDSRALGGSIRQVGSTDGQNLPVVLNRAAYQIERPDGERLALTFLEHA